MSTDTSSALDQPTVTAATPKNPRDKIMRIATMTRQLLDEVHTQTLDTASRERLGTIDTHIIDELLTDLVVPPKSWRLSYAASGLVLDSLIS